ncbi:hypothetical protein RUND412_008025 [Rhizina undulata]
MPTYFRNDTEFARIERLPRLPLGWVQWPNSSARSESSSPYPYCATTGEHSITFAVVTLVTSLGALALAHTDIVGKLLRLFRLGSSRRKSVTSMTSALESTEIFQLGFAVITEIVSTVIGAEISMQKLDKGQQPTIKLGPRIIMLLARPRGTWFTLVFFVVIGKVNEWLKKRKRNPPSQRQYSSERADRLTNAEPMKQASWIQNYKESLWVLAVGEILLEAIGVVPSIIFLNLGRKQTQEIVDDDIPAAWTTQIERLDEFNRILIAGAAIYVVGHVVVIVDFMALVYCIRKYRRQRLGNQIAMHNYRLTENDPGTESVRPAIIGLLLRWGLFLGWIASAGSWMLWVGFLEVAGDL